MSEANALSVPADPNVNLHAPDLKNEPKCNVPYREAIGSLLYLATVRRPDISFIVNKLSKYLSNHDSSHWRAVKRVFAYLKGTMNVGILYRICENGFKVVGYSSVR